MQMETQVTEKKKPTKGIVGVGLFVVLLLVFGYFWFGFHGNPITKVMANGEIKKYAEEKYPGQEYTLSKVQYEFKEGAYWSTFQLKSSQDTRFDINYYGKGDISDDYGFSVASKYTTLERFENAYTLLLNKEILLSDAKLRAWVYDDDNVDYGAKLKLDQPFSVDAGVKYRLSINTESDKYLDLNQQEKLIKSVYSEVKKHGFKFETYELDVELLEDGQEEGRSRYISSITPAIIESGKLMEYLIQENKIYDDRETAQ